MVDACEHAGVLFAGGALSKAYPQVHEAAQRLREGVYGTIIGASIHAWSAEVLGAGCQHTSVLRLLTGAEVEEVVAWCEDYPSMRRDTQGRLVDAVDGQEQETGCREPIAGDSVQLSAQFKLSTGLTVPVFGSPNIATESLDGTRIPNAGVRVWTDRGVLVWSAGGECGPPLIFEGVDPRSGARQKVDPEYRTPPHDGELPWAHLTNSVRSMVDATKAKWCGVAGVTSDDLAVSGNDIRIALEVSTAAYHSAMRGGTLVSLPLLDRRVDPVYPRGYRWGGGDSVGSVQTAEEVAEKGGRSWDDLSTGYGA